MQTASAWSTNYEVRKDMARKSIPQSHGQEKKILLATSRIRPHPVRYGRLTGLRLSLSHVQTCRDPMMFPISRGETFCVLNGSIQCGDYFWFPLLSIAGSCSLCRTTDPSLHASYTFSSDTQSGFAPKLSLHMENLEYMKARGEPAFGLLVLLIIPRWTIRVTATRMKGEDGNEKTTE